MSQQETAVAIRMQDLSPEYAEIMVIGNVLQKSGYFKDVRDQAQAVAKILYGRELGFSPIVSMSGIHIIEGKPALSSNLLAAMIKRSGKYDYRVVKMDDAECTLMFRQKVDGIWEDVGVASFTIDDAKRAGVVRQGSGWTRFPKSMLFARAISLGERTYCPDVSSCALYVPEELGATVDESGEVTELPPERTNGRGPRPVTYTTETTPIDPPAVLAEEIAGPASSGSAESGKTAAKAGETVGGQSERKVANDALPAETEVPSSAPAIEYCTREQQDWLRLQFKEKLPAAYKVQADPLRREWLANEGFKDDKGVGTSTKIPAAKFKDVAKRCVNHAVTLAELAKPAK